MPYEITLFDWLVGNEFPLRVPVTLGIDPLSGVLLAAAAFVGLLSILQTLLVGAGRTGGGPLRCRVAALSLWFSTALLFVSADYFVLFIFWALSSLAAGALLDQPACNDEAAAGGGREPPEEPTAAQNLLLLTRVTDAVLLFGLLLLWARFGSLAFSTVLGDSEQPAHLAGDAPGILTAIGVCFLVGVAARCAQLPFFGWLDRSARVPPRAGALLHAAFMPAGAYLIARSLPLFEAAPAARLAVAAIGGATALFASAIACAASNWTAALSRSSSGYYGLILVGLATGTPAGFAGAILLLVTHSLVKGGLLLAGDRAGWTGAAGIAVLASGLWGQNAILSTLWSDEAMAGARLPDGGRAVLLVAAAGGMFLTAFALVRAYLTDEQRGAPAAKQPVWPSALGIGAAVCLGLIAVLPGQPFDRFLAGTWPHSGVSTRADAFATGLSLVLALLGGVSAWTLSARRSAGTDEAVRRFHPAGFRHAGGSLSDRLLERTIIVPIRWSAAMCRLVERGLAAAAGLPAGIPRMAEWIARPLQGRAVQFYAVALCLATAVLLAVLTWLGE